MTSNKINRFLVDMYKNLCETVEDYDIIYKDRFYKKELLDNMIKTEVGKNKWLENIEKNEYSFYIKDKDLIQKNKKYDVIRCADMCIGFQSSKDVYVNLYFGGSLIIENFFLEKDKITYLQDPIVFNAIPYNLIQLKSEEDFEIQCIYLFVKNEYRRFLAKSKFFFKSTIYRGSYLSNGLNEKCKEQLLLEGFTDFSYYLDINELLKMKKKNKEIKKYREELVIKTWHPSRVEKWCM